MTDPARAWPPKGRGVNSLVGGARRRTGPPLEPVPAPEPGLEPLPEPWRPSCDLCGATGGSMTRRRHRHGTFTSCDDMAGCLARFSLLRQTAPTSVPGPGEALRPGPGTAPAGELPGPTGTDTAVSYG